VGGPTVPRRLDLVLEIAGRSSSLDDAITEIATTVGSGLHISEAVPAAMGVLLAADGDPFLTVVAAANLGDDTDTIACMAGSIAGAYRGFGAVPQGLFGEMLAAHNLDIASRARAFADVVAARQLVA
jgi:ADP-ribosylglycohydrolase